VIKWAAERAAVGYCALQVGLSERALRMTAEYTSGRIQFDRPLATFQAVQQRAADAYVDVEAMRVTMWHAAWRLGEGLPAADEVAVAKFWASEGGQRVAAATQHLHGGMGVDMDYPLHRFTFWSKQLELALGGANRQLARVGRSMAANEPEGCR
jgi:alkylation response protein AidB-like acyl-CoA dehydrogenase